MCTPRPAAVAEKLPATTPLPAQVPPAGVARRFTSVSVKHTLGGALVMMILGSGFTVMVKLWDRPVQLTPPLMNVGVTVIVAVTAEPDGLIATKAGIVPLPPAPNPIEVLLLLQVNTVPGTVVANAIAAKVDPAHTV